MKRYVKAMNASHQRSAFSRIELLFSLAAIGLVISILVATPRLTARQKLSRCQYNLKNVVLASLLWMEDNETGKLPWRRPVDQKGTFGFEPATRRNECWFQMMSFSNQLGTPKFFVDPADRGARIAKTWDQKSGTGFAAPEFQDRACSYGLSLDYLFVRTGLIPFDFPFDSFIFSDRHLEPKAATEYCKPTGISATALLHPFNVWWSGEVHGSKRGNVGLADGSVEMTSSQRVKNLLPGNADYTTMSRSAHFLFPRRSSAKSQTAQ
jgi:prepilin-type processing-associated H-X9-DG protein